MTLIQYIGELCQYLVNVPEDPLDKVHNIRLIFGNDLHPEVCCKFQECGEGDTGTIGLFQAGLRIVKVDMSEEMDTRLFYDCAPGETSELIITLADNKTNQTRFDGYYNRSTMLNPKLIQNAFTQGINTHEQSCSMAAIVLRDDGWQVDPTTSSAATAPPTTLIQQNGFENGKETIVISLQVKLNEKALDELMDRLCR
ncbi:hypothetical protein EDD11_005828 [Mortierella claussenii]|nr:hypothetical protein EDD11_005828 [Mortierella claussenii]